MQSLGPTTVEHQEDMEKRTGKMPGKQRTKLEWGCFLLSPLIPRPVRSNTATTNEKLICLSQ